MHGTHQICMHIAKKGGSAKTLCKLEGNIPRFCDYFFMETCMKAVSNKFMRKIAKKMHVNEIDGLQ